MKRIIGKSLMVFAALIVLGAAGDSDTGALTIEGAVLKVIAAIVLFAVGYILYKKVNTPEQKPESVTYNEEFVNRQATTPAYNKILPQRKEFVNHETY